MKLKIPIYLLVLLCFTATINAQNNLGVGTTSPDASAKLDVSSTSQGMLVPRMTQAQRNLIATPATGLLLWQTDATPGFYFYNGTAWTSLSATGSASDSSQVQKITEAGNTGWRFKGFNPANYGNIGSNAVDLSISSLSSSTFGATGTNAVAMGSNASSSGNASVSMGISTISSGWGSVALGSANTASAQGATAIGQSNTASGFGASAMGFSVLASGGSSFASGNATTASGTNAIAMGSNSQATSSNAIAIGNTCFATATSSLAMGLFTTASGSSSTAMGSQTIAKGLYSTAFGDRSLALGNTALAAGTLTEARGDRSASLGVFTKAKSYTEMAIGIYNDTLKAVNSTAFANDTNRLFTVGNGANAALLKTAFVIQQNGNVGINQRKPSEKLDINGSVKIVDGTQGAGKVLTSDANGKASWATPGGSGSGATLELLVTKTSGSQILASANGTNTGDLVTFNNVVTSPTSGSYSTSTNAYTASVAGLYYIQASSRCDDNATPNSTLNQYLYVDINGGGIGSVSNILPTFIGSSPINMPAGSKGRGYVGTMVYLNANDVVTIKGLSANSSGGTNLKTDGSTRFMVVKMF